MSDENEKRETVDGLPAAARAVSRLGLWDSDYGHQNYGRQTYAEDTTVRKGAAFLNDPAIRTVEDWGCGYGGLKLYLPAWIQYVGIDGSQSKFADKIADLESYRSSVDAVFLRHVLEHNPNWHLVLENAVASFTRKMVLVLFTPFQPATRVLREYPGWGGTPHSMWDIGFRREDIISRFSGAQWSSEEGLRTQTGYGVEHIFYLWL